MPRRAAQLLIAHLKLSELLSQLCTLTLAILVALLTALPASAPTTALPTSTLSLQLPTRLRQRLSLGRKVGSQRLKLPPQCRQLGLRAPCQLSQRL